jgi:AcrR family transcriptional regulator
MPASISKDLPESKNEAVVRSRILSAAFTAFMKAGYAATSTLEIASRACVSKRELYSLVGNKQEILIACIGERASRLKVPSDLPVIGDRETLAQVLSSLGTQLVYEITDPTVIAVFRLAIAEAIQAPEVARMLDSIGRAASRDSLQRVMARASEAGLINGRPATLSQQFYGLLWGDLLVSLLLGVESRPGRREITARARDATATFLSLYPARDSAGAVTARQRS